MRDTPQPVIPDGEVIAGEIKLHNLDLVLLKVDALEATQHLWCFVRASREVDIKLRNLASINKFSNLGELNSFVLPLSRQPDRCFVM